MNKVKQIKDFLPTDRFLSIEVYKNNGGGCAGLQHGGGSGISDQMSRIFIPCPGGNYTFEELEANNYACLIFIPEQRGPNYHALKPLMQPQGLVGPMSGGNLAYSSDSRCKLIYHVHDRFETQEVYDHLST